MKINDLLNDYLLYKLKLNPLSSNVRWNSEECMECSSLTYALSIDGFEVGIKVTETELLDYLLKKYNNE